MEPTHIFQDVSLCERFQACPASSNQLKEIWRVKRKEKQKKGENQSRNWTRAGPASVSWWLKTFINKNWTHFPTSTDLMICIFQWGKCLKCCIFCPVRYKYHSSFNAFITKKFHLCNLKRTDTSWSHKDQSTECAYGIHPAGIKCGSSLKPKGSTVLRVWNQFASLQSSEVIMSSPLTERDFFLYPWGLERCCSVVVGLRRTSSISIF